jgi:hypothetical protein
MKIIAWAYFKDKEEKQALLALVERCESYMELYMELVRLYPEEDMVLINMLARRLIEEKK